MNKKFGFFNLTLLNLSLIDQCVIFRILITNGIEMISGLIKRFFQFLVPLKENPKLDPKLTGLCELIHVVMHSSNRFIASAQNMINPVWAT